MLSAPHKETIHYFLECGIIVEKNSLSEKQSLRLMSTFPIKPAAADLASSRDARNRQKCECAISLTLLVRNHRRRNMHFQSSSEDWRY
jgi:hypothetical protein